MKGIARRGKIFWFRGKIPNGEFHQWSLGTSDELEAMQNYRTKLAELAMTADPLPAGESWLESVRAYGDYQRKMHHSDGTLRQRKTILTAIGRDAGWSDPARVTTAQVKEWNDRSTVKPYTQMKYLGTLSVFFKWLVKRRVVAVNPCDALERPEPGKIPKAIRRRFLPREDAQRLLDTPCGEDLKFALFCALHAGLRKGEICAALPAWFDLEAGLLHITANALWRTKGNADRTIPLTKQFSAFLKAYGLRSPYMMRPDKKGGKHTHRIEFRRAFANHLKTCGITGCTFHDLRRTFASLHVSSGTPIFVVAKWLGDTITVVERHYAHLAHQGDDIEKAWKGVATASGKRKSSGNRAP